MTITELEQSIQAELHSQAKHAPDARAVQARALGLLGRRRRLVARRLVAPLAVAVAVLIPVASVVAIRDQHPPTSAAAGRAALIGPNWHLATYRHGTAAPLDFSEDLAALVTFHVSNDLSYSFYDGCNDGTGSLSIRGGTLSMTPGSTTLTACGAPARLARQRAMAELTGAVNWQVHSGTLTLRTSAGSTLTFVTVFQPRTFVLSVKVQLLGGPPPAPGATPQPLPGNNVTVTVVGNSRREVGTTNSDGGSDFLLPRDGSYRVTASCANDATTVHLTKDIVVNLSCQIK